jgi:hypothetical protein
MSRLNPSTNEALKGVVIEKWKAVCRQRWRANNPQGASRYGKGPQLFRTSRPEALALGHTCVLSRTPPALPVQTARRHAIPCCVLLRQATAGADGPEASGGSGGGKCLLNVLSPSVALPFALMIEHLGRQRHRMLNEQCYGLRYSV